MTISLKAGLTGVIVPNPSDLKLLGYWNYSSGTADQVTMHYEIDWGDGSTHSTNMVLIDRTSLPQEVVYEFHNYLTAGTYTIHVHMTATWPADYSSGHFYPDIDETATIDVTVREPETIVISPDSGATPLPVSLSGTFLVPASTANEPTYDPAPAGTYPVTIDWGDGSDLVTGVVDAATYPRGFLYDITTFMGATPIDHTYTAGGTFTATFSVFPPGGGGALVTETFTVTTTGNLPLSLSARPSSSSYSYS